MPPPIAGGRRAARRVTSEFHRLAQDAARVAHGGGARGRGASSWRSRRGRCGRRPRSAPRSTPRRAAAVLRRRGVLGAAANARPPTPRRTRSSVGAAANARRGRRGQTVAQPPALLEVGAVNTQLLEARGLAVRAIDVRSSMQRIERVDFFDLRPQGSYLRGNQPVSYVTTRPRGQRRVDGLESPHHRTGAATEARRVDGVGRLNSDFHTGSYDVVVCALVLNCLPDAAAGGRMVAGLVAHLRPGGLCFLVVPRSCLERSAATTPARFDAAPATRGPRGARAALPRRRGLEVDLSTLPPAGPTRRRRRRPSRRRGRAPEEGEQAQFDVVAGVAVLPPRVPPNASIAAVDHDEIRSRHCIGAGRRRSERSRPPARASPAAHRARSVVRAANARRPSRGRRCPSRRDDGHVLTREKGRLWEVAGQLRRAASTCTLFAACAEAVLLS